MLATAERAVIQVNNRTVIAYSTAAAFQVCKISTPDSIPFAGIEILGNDVGKQYIFALGAVEFPVLPGY